MTSLDPVLDAFNAWQASRNPREYPAERQAFYAGWLAAMQSQEMQALREALEMIAGMRPCPDSLMGNADIARAALDHARRVEGDEV